jgi:uncharacterized membrane protein YfbV (UPF0208 family)
VLHPRRYHAHPWEKCLQVNTVERENVRMLKVIPQLRFSIKFLEAVNNFSILSQVLLMTVTYSADCSTLLVTLEFPHTLKSD